MRRTGVLSGTIASVPRDGADILVALHACDTATDDALAAGVASKASLMVVSPCCHREVRFTGAAPGAPTVLATRNPFGAGG